MRMRVWPVKCARLSRSFKTRYIYTTRIYNVYVIMRKGDTGVPNKEYVDFGVSSFFCSFIGVKNQNSSLDQKIWFVLI